MSVKKNNKAIENTRLDDNSHVSEIIKEKLTALLEPSQSATKSTASKHTNPFTEADENTTTLENLEQQLTSEQAALSEQAKNMIDIIEQNITEQDFENVLKNDEREQELNSKGYVYINVIETFVKEIIVDYMEQYASCACSHCMIDTMALALTNLPSKYIVVKKGDISPLLHMYRTKYFTRISTEVLKACLAVSKSPHHDR